MSTEASTRGARVIPIPPPLFYGIAFGLSMALHAMTGDRIGGRPAAAWFGAALIVGGLALAVAAIVMFVRSHTTVVPHHVVARLVTTGPYRVSRNPMYAGLSLMCLGGAFTLDTWWPIVTLVPALLLVHLLVIRPEERYLAEAFGADYAAYCDRVRRWL